MIQSEQLADLIADVKEQVLYLRELGVGTFYVKLNEQRARVYESRVENPASATVLRPVSAAVPEFANPFTKPPKARPTGQSRLLNLPSLANRNVSATRTPTPSDEPQSAKKPTAGRTLKMPEPIETIEQIRAEIGHDCTRCKLSALGRSQIVNSTGNFNADLMFVGEAPGADEDEQGFPFVGRAGKLLTDIMLAIGFNREDVFIGNINRCRPPKNRAPEPDETVACKPFLKREIAVVRPRVIVVLGATAAQNLLESKLPIGKLRGYFHDYLGTRVMPTFHPAYLLRDPHKKREVWEDMKMVRDYLKSL